MSGVEITALISVVGNLFLGIWGLFKKKKLAAVSEGLVLIETAVEENKETIGKIPHGKAVTKAIEEFGPVAKTLVDVARKIANGVVAPEGHAGTVARSRGIARGWALNRRSRCKQ